MKLFRLTLNFLFITFIKQIVCLLNRRIFIIRILVGYN